MNIWEKILIQKEYTFKKSFFELDVAKKYCSDFRWKWFLATMVKRGGWKTGIYEYRCFIKRKIDKKDKNNIMTKI